MPGQGRRWVGLLGAAAAAIGSQAVQAPPATASNTGAQSPTWTAYGWYADSIFPIPFTFWGNNSVDWSGGAGNYTFSRDHFYADVPYGNSSYLLSQFSFAVISYNHHYNNAGYSYIGQFSGTQVEPYGCLGSGNDVWWCRRSGAYSQVKLSQPRVVGVVYAYSQASGALAVGSGSGSWTVGAWK